MTTFLSSRSTCSGAEDKPFWSPEHTHTQPGFLEEHTLPATHVSQRPCYFKKEGRFPHLEGEDRSLCRYPRRSQALRKVVRSSHRESGAWWSVWTSSDRRVRTPSKGIGHRATIYLGYHHKVYSIHHFRYAWIPTPLSFP